MSTFKIAVIEGDGIGHEVVPEGLRVLEAAGKKFGLSYEMTHFDWSCEVYAKTGRMIRMSSRRSASTEAARFDGETGLTLITPLAIHPISNYLTLEPPALPKYIGLEGAQR